LRAGLRNFCAARASEISAADGNRGTRGASPRFENRNHLSQETLSPNLNRWKKLALVPSAVLSAGLTRACKTIVVGAGGDTDTAPVEIHGVLPD
jgi:hypothetical protein